MKAYRSKWINEGATFNIPSECPENWNLEAQLTKIGVW